MFERWRLCAPALIVSLAACGGLLVRQSDLDSWVGVPVEALDTHSFFLTVPMTRTITSSGMEVRNYVNARAISSCTTDMSSRPKSNIGSEAVTTCSNDSTACNNIFYIKNGKVVEYAPTGQCLTNSSLRPQARYLQLKTGSAD